MVLAYVSSFIEMLDASIVVIVCLMLMVSVEAICRVIVIMS